VSPQAHSLVSLVVREEVRKSIERCMLLLNHARTNKNGHKDLIIGGDTYDNYIENDLFKLHSTCLFMKQVFINALDHFPKHSWTWCCESETKSVSRLLDTKLCGQKIARKWGLFRERNQFHHPRGPEGLKANYER
jgi:hypothetical protein